jgi:hypothetical protein
MVEHKGLLECRVHRGQVHREYRELVLRASLAIQFSTQMVCCYIGTLTMELMER